MTTDRDAARPDEQRFFFMHLQKTAGTALWRRLQEHFPREAVYPGPDDGSPPESVLLVDHLLARWSVRREQIRVVTGHFPLCTTELLGAPFTTLTVLREPVERVLSQLRHHRETTPADRDAPLDQLYEEPIRRHGLLRNHAVKMLSLDTHEMTKGTMTRVEYTPARLELAKANLATVDAVGLQEHFEAFCTELTDRFGWSLGPPIFRNRTTPVPVSAALRRRIAEDNADDVELYEHARALHAPRRVS